MLLQVQDFSDGGLYVGEVRAVNKAQVFGLYVYPNNAATYVGYMDTTTLSAEELGMKVFKDGSYQKGSFKNENAENVMIVGKNGKTVSIGAISNGFVVRYNQDGKEEYAGEIKDGKLTGYGVATSAGDPNTLLVCEFQEGHAIGKGLKVFKDGRKSCEWNFTKKQASYDSQKCQAHAQVAIQAADAARGCATEILNVCNQANASPIQVASRFFLRCPEHFDENKFLSICRIPALNVQDLVYLGFLYMGLREESQSKEVTISAVRDVLDFASNQERFFSSDLSVAQFKIILEWAEKLSIINRTSRHVLDRRVEKHNTFQDSRFLNLTSQVKSLKQAVNDIQSHLKEVEEAKRKDAQTKAKLSVLKIFLRVVNLDKFVDDFEELEKAWTESSEQWADLGLVADMIMNYNSLTPAEGIVEEERKEGLKPEKLPYDCISNKLTNLRITDNNGSSNSSGPYTTAATSVQSMNENQVVQWLTSLGAVYATYGAAFKDNGIDGKMLMELTAEDLADLGVSKLHSKKIMQARGN